MMQTAEPWHRYHPAICAVQSTPMAGITSAFGYLYDADGTRVAKGTITPSPNPLTQPLSYDPTANGFQFTENYVLGPGGEELTMQDGNGNWQRTNVYAGGKLLATCASAKFHPRRNAPDSAMRQLCVVKMPSARKAGKPVEPKVPSSKNARQLLQGYVAVVEFVTAKAPRSHKDQQRLGAEH
jgi:hypothetical protein